MPRRPPSTSLPAPDVDSSAVAVDAPISAATRTYTVTLPLPPRECSPNWRGHWATKHRAVRAYRAACGTAYRAARIPALQTPVTVDLTFYLYRPTEKRDGALKAHAAHSLCFPRDDDNAIASFKAGRDALADAHIIHNDSACNLRVGRVTLLSTVKEHGGKTQLVVTITESAKGSE